MPRDEIVAIVNDSPDVAEIDETWRGRVVDCAMSFAAGYCNLPRYPERSHGGVFGCAGVSGVLTGARSGGFLVSVDGGPYYSAWAEVRNCTDGAGTAAELQRAIRACVVPGQPAYEEMAAVSVEWAESGRMEVLSPTYGRGSSVVFGYSLGSGDVVTMLGLTTAWGATEFEGALDEPDLDRAVARLATLLIPVVSSEPEAVEVGIAKAAPQVLKLDQVVLRVFQRVRRLRVR